MDDAQGTILYLATCHGMAKSRELLDKAVAFALTAKDAVENGEKIKRLVKKAYRAYRTAEIVQDAVLPEEGMPDWESFAGQYSLDFKVDDSVPSRLRYKGKEVLSYELFWKTADAMTAITDKGSPTTKSLHAAMREKYYYWAGQFFILGSDKPETDFDASTIPKVHPPLHAEFQGANMMDISKQYAAWMLDLK
jgi:hypothetical protein